MRPITISAPDGSLANPLFPAPTIARFCPGNILAETVMRALAPVRPDSVSAGIGNLKVTAYSGLRAGGAWVLHGHHRGQLRRPPGLRRDRRGRHPLRQHAQQPDRGHRDRTTRCASAATSCARTSAGAGRWRGGLGSIRDVEFLEAGASRWRATATRRAVRPLRRRGGQHRRADAEPGPGERALPSMIPYRRMAAGDVMRMVGPVGRRLRPAAGARPGARPRRRRPRLPRRRRRARGLRRRARPAAELAVDEAATQTERTQA